MRDMELGQDGPVRQDQVAHQPLGRLAQVPCRYCVVADTEFARLEGATARRIDEAVSMAGVARSFGALIDGLQVDEATFRREWDRMTPGADKAMARRASELSVIVADEPAAGAGAHPGPRARWLGRLTGGDT